MRLIDGDAFVDKFAHIPMVQDAIRKAVDVMPTVDAVPVVHGRWKRNKNGTYSCSKCQSWIPNEQKHYANFCLYCGARMDAKEGDENGEVR